MKYDIDALIRESFENDETDAHLSKLNKSTLEKANAASNGFSFKRASALVAVCIAAVLLVGTSVFAVSEIAGGKWSSGVEFENGDNTEIAVDVPYKSLPESALLAEDTVQMTLDEAEWLLGFSLLHAETPMSDTVAYSSYPNEDGNLARVDIWCADWCYVGNGTVNLFAVILNEGADEGYVLSIETGVDATGGKKFTDKFFSDSLNTDVIIYSSGANGEEKGDITATFVYDSVLYELIGEAEYVTQEELISVIEAMH